MCQGRGKRERKHVRKKTKSEGHRQLHVNKKPRTPTHPHVRSQKLTDNFLHKSFFAAHASGEWFSHRVVYVVGAHRV